MISHSAQTQLLETISFRRAVQLLPTKHHKIVNYIGSSRLMVPMVTVSLSLSLHSLTPSLLPPLPLCKHCFPLVKEKQSTTFNSVNIFLFLCYWAALYLGFYQNQMLKNGINIQNLSHCRSFSQILKQQRMKPETNTRPKKMMEMLRTRLCKQVSTILISNLILKYHINIVEHLYTRENCDIDILKEPVSHFLLLFSPFPSFHWVLLIYWYFTCAY